MKYRIYFSLIIIPFLSVLFFPPHVNAQEKIKKEDKKEAIKKMIDDHTFIFVANTAIPLRGGFRNLTSSYDVALSKDSLNSYLPYFGRAFNPPYSPTESVLIFISKDFSYEVSPFKNEGWNVVIKPRDKSEIQQYVFTIFDNGSASLNVTCTSRDAISFNGYVEEKKE